MDWQTPFAIAIALLAAAYVLWRWLKPLFARPADCCGSPQNDDELLQIEQ